MQGKNPGFEGSYGTQPHERGKLGNTKKEKAEWSGELSLVLNKKKDFFTSNMNQPAQAIQHKRSLVARQRGRAKVFLLKGREKCSRPKVGDFSTGKEEPFRNLEKLKKKGEVVLSQMGGREKGIPR